MNKDNITGSNLVNTHDRESLLALMALLGIEYTLHEHPPVFTVEQAQQHCSALPGVHCKNLFLKNKKKHYWLIVLLDDTKVDLKTLANQTGAGNFSFASEARLMEYLGVVAGSVTPLALVNDTNTSVKLWIEKDILNAALANFHPLENTATVTITAQGLRTLLDSTGHIVNELVLEKT